MTLTIKKAFDITRENIIIIQPFIIYMLVNSITSVGLMRQTNRVAFIVFFIANFLLTTAFLAGWFYMVKKTVEQSKVEYDRKKDKMAASFDLIKEFFPGVGAYFIPVTVVCTLIFCVVFAICYLGLFDLGLNYLKANDVHVGQIVHSALQSQDAMEKYLNSLTFSQLKAINFVVMASVGCFLGLGFLTMFWFPALINTNGWASPFCSFIENLKFIFKNFIGIVGIVCFLAFLNFLMLMINAIFSVNIILSIIALFIMFYYSTYYIILIFLYYDEKK